MSQRLSEYLTQETTDYLNQLDRLLSLPGKPDAEHILRLARGVRGSAQMAGLETIASVAERLEDAVRSVLSNTIIWSDEIRQLGLQTVRDLQILVRALNRWGPGEEARVREAIERWAELDPGEPTQVVPISDLYFEDDGPHVLSTGTAADAVVPIEDLLLRGESALLEALRLRTEIQRLARDAHPDLAPHLADLFELIQLGLSESGRPAA